MNIFKLIGCKHTFYKERYLYPFFVGLLSRNFVFSCSDALLLLFLVKLSEDNILLPPIIFQHFEKYINVEIFVEIT